MAQATSYAVAIRRTFAAAEYPQQDSALVQLAAERLAGVGGDLGRAIPGVLDRFVSIQASKVDTLLRNYESALREVGRPDLIAARFARWAEYEDTNARYHRETEAEFTAKAAVQREKAADWPPCADTAADFERQAAAAASCAHTCEQLAAKYRARAEHLTRASQLEAA